MIKRDDLDRYLKHISDDYNQQSYRSLAFRVGYEIGRKYLKVYTACDTQKSVHSFIVIKDDAKFKAGDILMAASFNAPARNFSRGNITGDLSRVHWTGAL